MSRLVHSDEVRYSVCDSAQNIQCIPDIWYTQYITNIFHFYAVLREYEVHSNSNKQVNSVAINNKYTINSIETNKHWIYCI